MLKWLRAPTLPRYFVLDLLDFVLSNTATVFRCADAAKATMQQHVLAVMLNQGLHFTQL